MIASFSNGIPATFREKKRVNVSSREKAATHTKGLCSTKLAWLEINIFYLCMIVVPSVQWNRASCVRPSDTLHHATLESCYLRKT